MHVIDLHCDTIREIWLARLRGEQLSLRPAAKMDDYTMAGSDHASTAQSHHSLQIDLQKLQEGGYLLQNFALFADLRMPAVVSAMTPKHACNQVSASGSAQDSSSVYTMASMFVSSPLPAGEYMDPWFQVTEMIRVFGEEMAANAGVIRQVRCRKDLEENMAAGRISALLTTEEGGILQGKLERLETLFDAGVRMMTITWNYENELGFPNRPPEGFSEDFCRFFQFQPQSGNGLTAFGADAVKRMEELHILPDVSHLSDEGFFDVARIVKGPFVASHSNARALCGCNRNLTDEMIRMIGEHGGVIGLNLCPSFLTEADREEDCFSSCEALSRHARHIMNVGGKEVLALGSDFDGIRPVNLEMEHAGQVQKLASCMRKNGFTEDEIERIYYRNALRLYREVL